MFYIPSDLTEYYFYLCSSESKSQLPPPTAKTTLDNNYTICCKLSNC